MGSTSTDVVGFLGHSCFPVLWVGNLARLSAASREGLRVKPGLKSLGERKSGTSSGAVSLLLGGAATSCRF